MLPAHQNADWDGNFFLARDGFLLPKGSPTSGRSGLAFERLQPKFPLPLFYGLAKLSAGTGVPSFLLTSIPFPLAFCSVPHLLSFPPRGGPVCEHRLHPRLLGGTDHFPMAQSIPLFTLKGAGELLESLLIYPPVSDSSPHPPPPSKLDPSSDQACSRSINKTFLSRRPRCLRLTRRCLPPVSSRARLFASPVTTLAFSAPVRVEAAAAGFSAVLPPGIQERASPSAWKHSPSLFVCLVL